MELAGNLGFIYFKLGDFKQAVKTLSAALALAPGRSSSWVNLAEAYAVQDQQRAAVACYALAFHFAQNPEKIVNYLQKQVASAGDLKVQQAAQQALQLSLISGEEDEEIVADVSAEDWLDDPLSQPAAQTYRVLPVVTPPVAAAPSPRVAPPIAPTVASPPPAPVAPIPVPAAAPPAVAASPTAPTTSDTVQIKATGMGITSEAALQNAYSNAIQQALGLYVDAQTLVQNDQIVKDQVLTHSRGLIKEVKTVNQGNENGLYNVTILATVLKQPLIDKVKPILQTTAAIDGTSLHAQIVTEKKQTQDAQALLAEAIKPFIGPTLYYFTLGGEVTLDEKDKNKILVPIQVTPNYSEYNKAAQNLTTILEAIAINKRDYVYSTPKETSWDSQNKTSCKFSCDGT